MALVVLVLACAVHAQTTTAPLDQKLDFGAEGLVFPQATVVNGHVPRTAQLLGDAYRRKEPLEWRRVQLVADLGQVALPAAAPYLMDAMKDPSPAVRGEAARSAAMIEKAPTALLAAVEALLADPDATVRREAVLATAALARVLDQDTAAIERGLADAQPPVIAAALQRAWTPTHGKLIAQRLSGMPKTLHVEAADALTRIKAGAAEHADVLAPLLTGDVAQRAAAVRALGEMPAGASDAVQKMLADPHPTVRREAVVAIAKLDADAARNSIAIRMLTDPDLTVRQAAVGALTPLPSTEALAAIMAQLGEDYAPLHQASRAALIRPADDAVRQATIIAAGDLLNHANPRRREDGSYVLGRLRSDHAFDAHLALLTWDLSSSASTTDWPLVAQAAESLGRIGDPRAAERLMKLLDGVPDSLAAVPPDRLYVIGEAMGNALVAAGRLRHRPALDEAVAFLKLDPTGGVPGAVRAAAAFVVGVLGEEGKVPDGVDFLQIYASADETMATKFEGLKALGNLRYAPLADRLKSISESDLTPGLRWIAHWSYQRAANTTVPFTPAIERREPPVSISDLPR